MRAPPTSSRTASPARDATRTCGRSGRGGGYASPPTSPEDEALVALGGDCVAHFPIDADAADVGHEHARLAGDVRPHVPGVGLRVESGVAHVVDVLHPLALCPHGRLDGGGVKPAQMVRPGGSAV